MSWFFEALTHLCCRYGAETPDLVYDTAYTRKQKSWQDYCRDIRVRCIQTTLVHKQSGRYYKA